MTVEGADHGLKEMNERMKRMRDAQEEEEKVEERCWETTASHSHGRGRPKRGPNRRG